MLFTSILMPTYNRAARLRDALDSLAPTIAGLSNVEVIIVYNEPDHASAWAIVDRVGRFQRIKAIPHDKDDTSAVRGWNKALDYIDSDSQACMLAADDLIFHSGWLQAADAAYVEFGHEDVLIGLNDGRTHQFATHYIMTRKFIVLHHGGVMAVPKYKSWYLDVEASEIAKQAGRFLYVPEALVEHRHYGNRKAPIDPTYEKGSIKYGDIDRQTYNQRKAQGFPKDYPPIIDR